MEKEGMAIAGRVGIVPKGEFEPGRQYKRLDLVTYEGSVYIAKKDNMNVLPTDEEYWMFVINPTGVDIASIEKAGIVKPDGDTISVSEDGTISANITDIAGQTPTFEEAGERENIESGDSIAVLFGKIKKWFSGLKKVAFTGNYDDLSDKPSIPSPTKVKGNAEEKYRDGEVNLTPENIGAVDKAGDTMTGSLFSEEYIGSRLGMLSYNFKSPNLELNDETRYLKAFTIKITGYSQGGYSYLNLIDRYNEKTTLIIKFRDTSSTTDPGLEIFQYIGGKISTYIVKEDISTWSIYILVKRWNQISFTFAERMRLNGDITIIDQLVDSLPDGAQIATLATVNEIATKAVADEKGNNIANTYLPKNNVHNIIIGQLSSGGDSENMTALGITCNDTVTEVIQKLPQKSIIYIWTNSNLSTFSKSLPLAGGGVLFVFKYDAGRGIIKFFNYTTGDLYTSPYKENIDIKWGRLTRLEI